MLFSVPTPLPDAFRRAAARRVLPSALGSAAQRDALQESLRMQAVFSARTTNAVYLETIKEAVERALKGGYDNDQAKLRLELKQALQRLGYTPEQGFPGDAAHGIPSAEPGSLQDLSSDRRINLILDTQMQLMRGAGQQARGMDPDRLRAAPAWELVRIHQRRVPRGSVMSGSPGWEVRWVDAGGTLQRDARMIALKTDPIWDKLGDSALFPDALDVDHPPFAFNSGFGWREISASEWQNRGGKLPEIPGKPAPLKLPPSVFSTGRMDPEFKKALLAKLDRIPGKLTEEKLRDVKREMIAEMTAPNSALQRIAQTLLIALG